MPGAAQPGQIEQPFKREPGPRMTVPLDLPAVPAQLPDQARQIRFAVQEIVLEGSETTRPPGADTLLQSLSGQETSLADIYALAEKLTALYRNQGLVLSRVLVPEQRITYGRVRLVAVEGYIDDIVIDGASAQQHSRLQQYADRIKASRPLRADVLERYLLLMNDLAGSYAQAILRASPAGMGAANLIIRFSSRRSDASAEINNRGSKALGPINLVASGSIYSLLTPFDEFRASIAATPNDELQFISAAYDVPLGFEGLTAGASASVARAHPDVGSTIDIQTRSASADVHATYPLLRSRSQNLYVHGALAWLDGRTEVNSLPLTKDRVRSLRLGLSYDQTDRWLGINTANFDVVQGLNIGGATKSGASDSSRAGTAPDFNKITLYGARLQSLGQRVDLLAAVSGQYSHSKLLPSEQFGFGGATFGRVYDASELLGDSGAALKFELRYAGTSAGTTLRAYTIYGFYELGTVWRHDPINQKSRESAADAGLGVRFNLLQNLSGYVELATPLTRDVNAYNDRRTRGFAALRWTF